MQLAPRSNLNIEMTKMSKFLSFVVCNLIVCFCFGQKLTIDGYVFETGNRGFLDVVQIDVYGDDDKLLGTTFSDNTGHFEIAVPAAFKYKVTGYKDMFDSVESTVNVDDKAGDSDKLFVKLKMKRSPGYMFEITLAEKKDENYDSEIGVDAIKNSRIEVYNNTKKEEVMVLDPHPHPTFNVALRKGNHYTVLVRKPGYLAKRMEAFVDVEGCILCFEGLGTVNPGVSDNLTEGNQMGVLLANVELDKIYEGKTIPINNIFYQFGKSNLKEGDKEGLTTLATVMSDNPDLTVEIGAHTDSRGSNERNFQLSQERAQNVVDFLVDNGVLRSRLISRGYGETQLKNDCVNGVECTDRKHGENRRTELKVLGIAPVPSPIKSLAQIKQMEQGEALLKEIQFSGGIQIPLDSTAIDSEEADMLEKVINSNAEMQKEEEPEEDKKVMEEKSMEQMLEKVIGSDVEMKKENIEGDIADMKSKVMENNPSEIVEKKIAEKLDTEMATKAMEEKADDMGSIVSEDKNMSVVKEAMSEEVATTSNTTTDVIYRIVIKESETVLPDNDGLYDLHSNLLMMKDSDGDSYLYMIGEYDNITAINRFYKTVQIAYPDSYKVAVTGNQVEKL